MPDFGSILLCMIYTECVIIYYFRKRHFMWWHGFSYLQYFILVIKTGIYPTNKGLFLNFQEQINYYLGDI